MKWRRKLAAGERLEVRACFLDVILPEVGEPGVQRRQQPFERLRLGDADQGDARSVAGRATCRHRDALPHGGKPGSRILRNS